ncbi:MAG: hypothetical protein NTU95_04225 [Methanothrix sp.]|nr:hypothetical protein [Methanothrix sp.]
MKNVMRNLLKLFVVLLTINGAFMAVQASDANLPINAQLPEILSIEVKTPSLTWDLDPAHSPLIDNSMTIDKGVFVSTNMLNSWAVNVKADPKKLSDGTNTVAGFMTLKPGTPDWGKTYEINMEKPDTMWTADNKRGVDRVALGFSQPVSWEDVPSKEYRTTLTFTAGYA